MAEKRVWVRVRDAQKEDFDARSLRSLLSYGRRRVERGCEGESKEGAVGQPDEFLVSTA